jgi:membrane-bound metal-dependent hydrolase YbcI (DUF457 family)
MNRRTHSRAGIVAGIGTYGLHKYVHQQPWELVQVAGAGIGGAVGGIVPDMLEPATNPHHRELFHSVAAGSIAILAGKDSRSMLMWLQEESNRLNLLIPYTVDFWGKLWLQIKKLVLDLLIGFILGFCGGYLSHVFLDSMTPNSIPWV